MKAIKMFNGSDFGGNKISVKQESDYVINLSQKRERSPSRQVLNLAPTSKFISLNGSRVNPEINLEGTVNFSKVVEKNQKNEEVLKTAPTKSVEESKKIQEPQKNQEVKPLVKEEKKTEPVKVEKNEEIKNKEIKAKEEIKEDVLMIEMEGSKFLKTEDENKLHCIACDKEITKKSLKAHVASKAHQTAAKGKS